LDIDTLLDPDYWFFLDEPSSEWTLANLPAIRQRISSGYKAPGTGRGARQWTSTIPGAPSVRVCVYRPDTAIEGQTLPAMLYIHGGGFVLGSPEMADDYLADLADHLQTVIVAVDYRLAPEHPFPAPLEDCYSALGWLVSEHLALGVDKDRVVIMGHSAGGGLAAALALLVRERGQHQVAGMALVYPMLDHRTGSPVAPQQNPTTGHLSWSPEANQFCWACMQGAYELNDDQAMLFSPALALDLKGLPPSFISVGALDLFLDEDVEFALKLSRAGVPVELHVYPGVPHMFDQYPGAMTDRCQRDVLAALSQMLARR